MTGRKEIARDPARLPAGRGTGIISPMQCRMARAGLGLSIREFARFAGVSGLNVTRFENGNTSCPEDVLRTFRHVLEGLGAKFTRDSDGNAGVFILKGSKEHA